jgi:hypothetical protein
LQVRLGVVVEPASAQLPIRIDGRETGQLLTKGSTPMFAQPVPYDSNQYRAGSSCPHCAGVTAHEAWCSTHNVLIQYAFLAVLYNDLTVGDTIILHALGVKWDRSLPDVSRHSRKAAQSSLLRAKRL